MKEETKTRILQRAAELFFAKGFSTGIDEVVRECDAAKMTVYNGFQSKEGLICAIIRDAQDMLCKRITSRTAEPSFTPVIRLEAAAHILCYGMNDPELMTGLGVRALMEFPDTSHPVNQAGQAMAREVLGLLQPMCEAAGHPDSLRAARQILLIAQGCFVSVPLLGLPAGEAVAYGLIQSIIGPLDAPLVANPPVCLQTPPANPGTKHTGSRPARKLAREN